MVKILPSPEKNTKNQQARLLIRVPEDQLENDDRIERCRAIARNLQNNESELSNIENRIRGVQHTEYIIQASLESSLDKARNAKDPENQRAFDREANRLRQDRAVLLSRLSQYEEEKNGIEQNIERLEEEARQNRCNLA